MMASEGVEPWQAPELPQEESEGPVAAPAAFVDLPPTAVEFALQGNSSPATLLGAASDAGALKRLLAFAAIPLEAFGAIPLQIPSARPIGTTPESGLGVCMLGSASVVHPMLVHSWMPLSAVPLAQWILPPPIPNAADGASSGPRAPPPPSSDVADSHGYVLRGPIFDAWTDAISAVLEAASRAVAKAATRPSSELVVVAVTAAAPYCSYVPWSCPQAAAAAEALFCALAASTCAREMSRDAGRATGGSCRRCGLGGPAAFERGAPLLEVHTCAHDLAAAFADPLLAHCRGAMKGDAWCTDGADTAARTARHTAHWVITHLRSPHLSMRRLGLALPVLLKLCDRWEATNAWLGASGFAHLFLHAAASDLRPHAALIAEALSRCRLHKSPGVVHAVSFARALALPALYGPPPALPPPRGGPAGSTADMYAQLHRRLVSGAGAAAGPARPDASGADTAALLADAFGASSGPYDAQLTECLQDISLSVASPQRAYSLLTAGLPIVAGLLGPRLRRHLSTLVPAMTRLMTESGDAGVVLAAAHVLRVALAVVPVAFTLAADGKGAGSSAAPAGVEQPSLVTGPSAPFHHHIPVTSADVAYASVHHRRDFIHGIVAAVVTAREQALSNLCDFRGDCVPDDPPAGAILPGCGPTGAAEPVAAEDAARARMLRQLLVDDEAELVGSGIGDEACPGGARLSATSEARLPRLQVIWRHLDALLAQLSALSPGEVGDALDAVLAGLQAALVHHDEEKGLAEATPVVSTAP